MEFFFLFLLIRGENLEIPMSSVGPAVSQLLSLVLGFVVSMVCPFFGLRPLGVRIVLLYLVWLFWVKAFG